MITLPQYLAKQMHQTAILQALCMDKKYEHRYHRMLGPTYLQPTAICFSFSSLFLLLSYQPIIRVYINIMNRIVQSEWSNEADKGSAGPGFVNRPDKTISWPNLTISNIDILTWVWLFLSTWSKLIAITGKFPHLVLWMRLGQGIIFLESGLGSGMDFIQSY